MSNLFQCNLLNPKQLYFNTVGNAFSNGFYLSGTNQLTVCTNGSAIANWDADGTYECETIVPHTTAAFDLGSNSRQWNNGFIVNAWTVSDVNKKSNITPLSSMVPDATKVVKQLKPIAFHYNHEKKVILTNILTLAFLPKMLWLLLMQISLLSPILIHMACILLMQREKTVLSIITKLFLYWFKQSKS